jgi:hypothetical protein
MGSRKFWVQITLTLVSLVCAGAHLIWPQLPIDSILIALLVLAVLPWFADRISAVEVAGSRVELATVERVGERIQGTALEAPSQGQATTYSFQFVSERDPNLALAGLRIEIERRMREIGRSLGLPDTAPLGTLIRRLGEHGVFTHTERSVLMDLLNALNLAIHGARVDPDVYEWAMSVGPGIIRALDSVSNSHVEAASS